MDFGLFVERYYMCLFILTLVQEIGFILLVILSVAKDLFCCMQSSLIDPSFLRMTI
jgi:hypothetical protein